MIKVVVDRTKWLRGEGSQNSYLRRRDGKMCCMGFFCLAQGKTEQDILSKEMVEEFDDDWPSPVKMFRYRTLYRVNDDMAVSDEQREARLAEVGREYDIDFSFIN